MRRFSTSDIDRVRLRALTREQTIDLMEKRQEAAVLRYMREITKLGDSTGPWVEVELLVTSERTLARRRSMSDMEKLSFRHLTNAQIAKVMAGEQNALEARLQKQVQRLRELHELKREGLDQAGYRKRMRSGKM